MQAAALHPETGQLWTVEHGARGGDELNHPEKGKNYGWPVITYGRDYSGAKIGEGTAKEGMEQPVYYWDPVIAPSGAVWYTGDRYPGWKGSLFVGSMQPGALVRLTVENGKVTKEERYLPDVGTGPRRAAGAGRAALHRDGRGRRAAASGGAEGLSGCPASWPNPSAARATSRC